MASVDPEHWLFRLDPGAWLAAAESELAAAEARIDERRSAITHARRAAGMALNAVLVAMEPLHGRAEVELRWGRSYVEHLRAVADADDERRRPLPVEAAKEAASLLAIAPVAAGERLIQLGARPHAAAHEALARARALVSACAGAVDQVRGS